MASTGPIADVFARWPMLWQSFDHPDEYDRLVRELPDDVVNLIAAECLFGEVFNGGFDQYFSNSSGISINEAIRGLRAMGFDKFADIAGEALALMGDKFVVDRAERWDRMYAETPGSYATNIFDHLDDRFYNLDRTEGRSAEIFEAYATAVLQRFS